MTFRWDHGGLTRQQRGYGADWQRLRASVLRDEPLCRMCTQMGRVAPATEVDHIVPFVGLDDPLRLARSNCRPLCEGCHRVRTSAQARGRGMTAVGADGWPIVLDEAPAAGKIWGYSIPRGVRPSAVPVHLVYGPPAAGKTTYVRERSAPADTVIDLDEILERVGGRRWSMERGPLNRAFAYRDRMIHGLADKAGGNAWLIISAPTLDERAAWAQALGSVQLHPVIAPPAECIRRIRSDADRAHAAPALVAAVRRWFDRASPARAA